MDSKNPIPTANLQIIIMGAYKGALLTLISSYTTVLNQEDEKKFLQADMHQSVSLLLHNSFCRRREQKVGVNLSQRSSGLKP